MADISRVSDKTFQNVPEVSSAPVIASCSSCRAISNVPRTMMGTMMVALAKKGGVIHINFNGGFPSRKTVNAHVVQHTLRVTRAVEHARVH
jgi:membrane dipeptidase